MRHGLHQAPRSITRRTALAGLMSATATTLTACLREQGAEPARWQGGWVGDRSEWGHRWRDDPAWVDRGAADAAAVNRRTDVLVLGAGVAGLAVSRALRMAGVEDLAVLELHDTPGGNSRGHRLAGLPCPMGAHYLPTPGDAAPSLQQWLVELGVARPSGTGLRFDERWLCHAPQERLWQDGTWHAGLLPQMASEGAAAAQAQRLARLTQAQLQKGRFAMPSTAAAWTAEHAEWDRQTFGDWLNQHGITDAGLRWYLDYCCRDDYGAPAADVSAWAGLQYFCSRHGFHAPGAEGDDGPSDAVLTWPEGNAWLVDRLADGLGERLLPGRMALRVEPGRHGVHVLVWHGASGGFERWQARQVVLASPLMVGARLLGSTSAPEALAQALRQQRVAPWLVANVLLSREPLERPGQPMAWDNVAFGQAALGYVNAQHQRLPARPRAGPVVLTAYHALPAAERGALLQQPWRAWAARVVADLAVMHPDLPATVQQVDLARHGHAMSIPVPGVRGSSALATLRTPGALGPRLHWAHTDLVGYSVFEEAFVLGDTVGSGVAATLRGGSPRAS